jgi:iron only hydrogenase large subunit-like protein
MLATSRYIKAENPYTKVVFIGPCIAKKGEANQKREGDVDYVLTTEEILAILDAKNTDFSKYNDKNHIFFIPGRK